MATSDLHARAVDWDYRTGAQHPNQNVGLACVGTLVERLRAERGAGTTLLLDNGGTIWGTALGRYYADQRRITDQDEYPHPMVAHAAMDGGATYGTMAENFVGQLAEEVPGIDAIVAGHDHRNRPEVRVVNRVSGDEVVVAQPASFGYYLAVIDVRLVRSGSGWDVDRVRSENRRTGGVPESRTVVDAVDEAHRTVVAHVNGGGRLVR